MPMQSAILNEANTPFSIETVELEAPKTGEVLIKMAAAGVCHSDWHVVEGLSYFPMPIICGHEGAGIVEAVGAGVARLSPGDHVTLSFRANCGACFYCQNNKPNLCEVYTPVLRSGLLKDGSSRISRNGEPVHIMTGLGCFAEYVVIPEEACVPVRADVPLEIAALVGCAVSTGVGAAMYTADVRPGQSVAVYGAGGVGLNLTAAGYVFLLDPWWNPAVEAQAIDRTHRIGQTQPVFAYRLIARDTVEEKMLELQRSKRQIADAILEGGGSSLRDLTADDLRLLLS